MRGFEPLMPFRTYRISSAAHSTTLAHLQNKFSITNFQFLNNFKCLNFQKPTGFFYFIDFSPVVNFNRNKTDKAINIQNKQAKSFLKYGTSTKP
jgi:hypothetical protein